MGCGADQRHKNKNLDELLTHKQWSNRWKVACNGVDDNGIIALIGTRGNGKTQMGVQLILRACKLYEPTEDELNHKVAKGIVSYKRLRELHMLIRQAYSPGSMVTESQAIEQFVTPRLLVVDECQEINEGKSDWAKQTFTYILDRRYGKMRPTVLIANCNQNQFRTLVGDSICDRIKEGGGIVRFEWDSFRGA